MGRPASIRDQGQTITEISAETGLHYRTLRDRYVVAGLRGAALRAPALPRCEAKEPRRLRLRPRARGVRRVAFRTSRSSCACPCVRRRGGDASAPTIRPR
jgi:hypothetical protein